VLPAFFPSLYSLLRFVRFFHVLFCALCARPLFLIFLCCCCCCCRLRVATRFPRVLLCATASCCNGEYKVGAEKVPAQRADVLVFQVILTPVGICTHIGCWADNLFTSIYEWVSVERGKVAGLIANLSLISVIAHYAFACSFALFFGRRQKSKQKI